MGIKLASSAGLSMGFSLRMGIEKNPNLFPTTRDSSGEMPTEEAIIKLIYNLYMFIFNGLRRKKSTNMKW